MHEIITFFFHKSYIQNGPQPVRPPHLNPYQSRLKLSACVCFIQRLQAASVPSGSVKESGPRGRQGTRKWSGGWQATVLGRAWILRTGHQGKRQGHSDPSPQPPTYWQPVWSYPGCLSEGQIRHAPQSSPFL